MDILETERLILREFTQDDLDDFYGYCKNPNIGPNAGWKPHVSKEDSAVILEGFITGKEVLAIVHKESRKVIGSIGLHNDDMRTTTNVKMVGFVLSEEFWGRGIMTEAVKRIMEYAFIELKLELCQKNQLILKKRKEPFPGENIKISPVLCSLASQTIRQKPRKSKHYF